MEGAVCIMVEECIMVECIMGECIMGECIITTEGSEAVLQCLWVEDLDSMALAIMVLAMQDMDMGLDTMEDKATITTLAAV